MAYDEVDPRGGVASELWNESSTQLGGGRRRPRKIVVLDDLDAPVEVREVQRLLRAPSRQNRESPRPSQAARHSDFAELLADWVDDMAIGGRPLRDVVCEESLATNEGLPKGIATHFAHERVDEPLLEGIPDARLRHLEMRVQARAEEALSLNPGPDLSSLQSLVEVCAYRDAFPGDILFRDVEPIELEAVVQLGPGRDLECPFVLCVDHDVLGPVGLRDREDVDSGDESQPTNDSLRVGHQKWIIAVANLEQELSAEETFVGFHVEAVGEIVDPWERPVAVEIGGIEDGVTVDENERYFTLGASLTLGRGSRYSTRDSDYQECAL